MPKSKLTLEQIDAAAKALQRFYNKGLKLVRKALPGKAKTTDGQAGTTGIDRSNISSKEYEQLRQAQQFADPTRGGFAKKELDALLKKGEKQKFIPSPSHFHPLVSLRGEDRRTIIVLLFKNRWSVGELKAEIRRLYPPRRRGGRPRGVPTEATALLAQLRKDLDTWKRWYLVLTTKAGPEQDAPSKALPRSVHSQLKKLQPLLQELAEQVDKELLKAVPSRNAETTTKAPVPAAKGRARKAGGRTGTSTQ